MLMVLASAGALIIGAYAEAAMVLVCDGDVLDALALRDHLRSDAAPALQALKKLGIKSLMLTGDNPRAAAAIARQLGIEYRASLLPADKVAVIGELSQQPLLAMVGDGINDAPATKAATPGIAMGSGTDVALEAADAAPHHPAEHRYCAGADRIMAGGTGEFRRHGAGHGQCAALTAPP